MSDITPRNANRMKTTVLAELANETYVDANNNPILELKIDFVERSGVVERKDNTSSPWMHRKIRVTQIKLDQEGNPRMKAKIGANGPYAVADKNESFLDIDHVAHLQEIDLQALKDLV